MLDAIVHEHNGELLGFRISLPVLGSLVDQGFSRGQRFHTALVTIFGGVS